MNVNIIGFGIMGKQIASLLYLFGYNVNIFSRKENEDKNFYRQIKLVSRALKESKEGKYTFFNSIADLPNEITIECVVEDINVKRTIYEKIRRTNNSLYFSNTSSLSPKEIANDVHGLHFFNPINMGLVEITIPKEKIDPSISMLIDSLQDNAFEVINVNNNRGYIGNYILFHEISSAFKLIEQFNYGFHEISMVYEKLYQRNIFSIVDVIGVDVTNKILLNLKEQDESIYLPQAFEKALENNILGKKNRTSIRNVLHGI